MSTGNQTFRLAHNGTIFLDEIGEIPLTLQSRLLRVLQEKEIIRVGGDKVLPINVRIISATNINLDKKVENREFREDLFYRLNVFSINIPPLRERKEDIEILVKNILERKYTINETDEIMIQNIMPKLKAYDWPGNVRQLNNVIERISILFNSNLTNSFREKILEEIVGFSEVQTGDTIALNVSVRDGLKSAVNEAEKIIIETMLKKYNNDINEVQKLLNIGRTTLWRKIKDDV